MYNIKTVNFETYVRGNKNVYIPFAKNPIIIIDAIESGTISFKLEKTENISNIIIKIDENIINITDNTYNAIFDVNATQKIKIIPEIVSKKCKISISNIKNGCIPLNLFQTWYTKDLPPAMKECVESLKSANPEFIYNLFDDEDCRNFILNNFDSSVVEAFDNLIPGAYKADLWRYCVLYIHGGVYLDIKFKCINGFKLIELTDKEYFVKDRPGFADKINGIYNAYMVCKAKNKILYKCIYQIVENVKNKYYGKNCLYPTGPALICNYFSDEKILEQQLRFDIFDIETILLNDRKILESYKQYRNEQNKKTHYYILWRKKNIYKHENNLKSNMYTFFHKLIADNNDDCMNKLQCNNKQIVIEPITNFGLDNRQTMLIDCQPLQHEMQGIGRYCLNLVNNLIIYNNDQYNLVLLINNYLKSDFLKDITNLDKVTVITCNFPIPEYEYHRYINQNENIRNSNQAILAKFVDNINPDIFLILSAFDLENVSFIKSLSSKNIKVATVLYDLIPLRLNMIDFNNKNDTRTKYYLDKLNNVKNSDLIFAISEFTKNDSKEVQGNNKIVNISTGVNDDIVKDINSITKKNYYQKLNINKPYILIQSAYSSYKGFYFLCNQFCKIKLDIRNNFQLVLASNVPENVYNEFKNIFILNNISLDDLIVTGRLTDDELSMIHSGAWLFVFPSQYEGFGLPIVEAMMHNVPAIAANNSSLVEVINNPKFMFELNDDSLTRLIENLYLDKNLYDECIENGNIQKKKFTWKNTATIALNELRNTIKKNILYYASTTSRQPFNTGIQRVVRNISVILGNNKNYNIFLIKEDGNEFELLDDNELKVFVDYGGYDHSRNNLYTEFKNIKNDNMSILFLPELVSEHHIHNNITHIAKKNSQRIYEIIYDDTIYTNNDMDKIFRENVYNNFVSLVSKSHTIFCISEYTKSRYIYHLNRLGIMTKQNIETIVLPGEMLNYNRIIHKNNNVIKKYIFANVSFTERKNIAGLVNAFNIFNQEYSDVKLYIIGKIDNRSNIYKNIKSKITENVIFCTDVSDDQLIEYYKNAIFTVYPSLEEGFGFPIYESLWNCTPIICHNETSTKEISDTINSPAVRCIDCRDINALYLEMKKLMDDDFRNAISEDIKNIKIDTWNEYVTKIYSFFNSNNVKIDKKIALCPVNTSTIKIFDSNFKQYNIFICKEVLNNNNYNTRGVGNFTREIILKFTEKNIICDEYTEHCRTILFTHPPPLLNNMDNSETKTFNLLKKICLNNCYKIIVIYDLIPFIFKNIYNPESSYYEYFELVKLNFDLIIAISESTKNDLINYFEYNPNKIIVYYPSISNDFLNFNQNYNLQNTLNKYNITKKYIICPLGDEYRKNIDNTILSFLNIKTCDYQLVFMFSIDERRKEYFNKKYNLQKKDIIFTGYVSNDEYKILIKNASLTLFISLYEGFGYCIIESLYFKVPVVTSNISSMFELSMYGKNEVIVCDPNNINDITNKINYFLDNQDIFIIKDSSDVIEHICNNNSINSFVFNYNMIQDIPFLSLDKYPMAIIDHINVNFKEKIKFINIKLDNNTYNKIINLFDINLQIRISTGGGSSGSVTDSVYLNKWVITTDDLCQNIIPNNYQYKIISKAHYNSDWISCYEKNGGYSPSELHILVDEIIQKYDQIKTYNSGVCDELDYRLQNYPHELKKCLNLDYEDNICFVTPYGSDKSGISDFSYSTIKEIKKWFTNVDIYTDCNSIENKNIEGVKYFKIDDININFNNYKKVIWVIGNSHFHNKMIILGKKFGGCFLLHDETLFELYNHNNWIPSNISIPHNLREITSNNKYNMLCFHDLIENEIIVHNDNLLNIFKNKLNCRHVFKISFPNYNLNSSDKLYLFQENELRKKLNIDNMKFNIFQIGGLAYDVKCFNYNLKIFEELNNRGIDTYFYIFYWN